MRRHYCVERTVFTRTSRKFNKQLRFVAVAVFGMVLQLDVSITLACYKHPDAKGQSPGGFQHQLLPHR